MTLLESGPAFTPATTSNNSWGRLRTRSSRIAGFGSHNMGLLLWFHRIGKPGQCGNTRMGPPGQTLTTCPEPVSATGIDSMAMGSDSHACGEYPHSYNRPKVEFEPHSFCFP